MRQVRTIVVVGGGTAGWMCANILKARTRSKIVVVESPNISPVGVGEALTPFFFTFLETIGYDPVAFIKDVQGSVKLAVRFENWMGENDVYYHPFQDGGGYALMPEFNVSPGYNRLISYALIEGIPVHNLTTSYALLCEQNKVPWFKNFREDGGNYQGYGSYAYHMDTKAFSDTFRSFAVQKAVDHIKGNVVSLNKNAETGFIESLSLEDGRTVDGDFFIDCTGFKRVLISTMSPEWESYSHWLPVNRAIPFNIEYGDTTDQEHEAVPPYTLARSLSAGWLWRNPVRDRYGSGYVYCDEFASEESALEEIKQNVDLSKSGPFGSPIRFESGTLCETWIKNCVAVGLSSGFIEPLESTAIQIALTQILGVVDVLRDPFSYNERVIGAYNKSIKSETDDIRDFIILHYVTKRNDTPFWQYISNNTTTLNYPDTLRDKIETARYRSCGHNRVQSQQIRGRVFGEFSHIYVMQALGLLNKESARADFLQEFDSVEEAVSAVGRHAKILQEDLVQFSRECMTHKDFLDKI